MKRRYGKERGVQRELSSPEGRLLYVHAFEHASEGVDTGDTALLSPGELARMQRFANPTLQGRWAFSRATLRRVLGDMIGCDPADVEFWTTCTYCGHPQHGKPRLLGSALRFSLSHSGPFVAIAISDEEEVGIDVEEGEARHSKAALHIARARFPDAPPSRDEAEMIGLRLWVRAEAVAKGTGRGWRLGPEAIRWFERDAGVLAEVPGGSRWWVQDLALEGLAAVALASSSRVMAPIVAA